MHFLSHRHAGRALALLLAACLGTTFAQTSSTGSTGSTSSSASSSPAPAPTACGDTGTGAPCSPAGGVATTPTAPTPDPAAGNPINLITGNKYQREVDLPPLPGVLGLEIIRHYNSYLSGRDSKNGILGRGWKLSYETELTVDGRFLDIRQADGSRITFTRDLVHPQRYHAATPWQGHIVADKKSHGTEYTWLWSNGRQLNFNAAGKLVQIVAPTGEFVSLQHDAKGLLVQVTDPQGRSLHLNYLDKRQAQAGDRFRGVQSIDSPVGRFTYAYGSELPKGATANKTEVLSNLVKVGIPTHYDAEQKVHPWANRGVTSSSISRLYHYEDARYPTLLTGISINGQGSDGKLMAQRLSTYGYDQQGRANLSVKGEPLKQDKDGKPLPNTGLEQVTLAWPKEGSVVLTNSLGQRTVYKTAIIGGEPRILEARGAGCSTCGPANMRYAYDAYGRLTEQTLLGNDGQPIKTTRTTLDGYGRALEISTIAYRNGKAQPAQWQVRYRYPVLNEANATQPQRVFSSEPSVIARPSVVPGKEHRIRIAYNAAGQPVSVTENGWAPSVNGGEATEITRTTTYRYHTINGRSVLAEIDGPLKNGPKNAPDDSDITRLTWDNRGNAISAMTAPGGFTSSIRYDEAGRLAQVQNAEGVQTTYVYDARSQLVSLNSTGPGWDKPKVTSYLYDALGQRTETGSGSQANDTYRGETKSAFDTLGRLLWIASAQGILQSYRYDSESRPLESSRWSGGMSQTQRYTYDSEGRLIQVADNTGASTTIGYDAQGLPEVLIDSLGRKKPLPFSAQTKDATPRKPRSASMRHLTDDFGRTIITRSPDSGTTTRRFDEADRLIASTDALGNRARYEYDAAGRIVRQTITPATASTGATQDIITQWRYAGKRLIALEHPTQSERYQYDERGLRIAKVIQRKHADGTQLSTITRYRYDAEGALQSISLPDGSHIEYDRDGQGQVVALERSRLQTRWLRWLLPAQTLAKDIQRDLIGLRHYAGGNGIETTYQRSKEGVLARVVVHRTQSTAEKQTQSAGRLLGVQEAHAASTSQSKPASALPGALGPPPDPRALFDYRYLWDTQGNLLHLLDKAGATVTANYAYDGKDRLIAAVQTQDKHLVANRYAYDRQGRRLLSQEGIAEQSDTNSRTRTARYERNTHRWIGDHAADEQQTVQYDAAGQPVASGASTKQRTYEWDALGRLVTVRQDQQQLARYTYNHRGERIAKEIGAHAGQDAHYLYEDRKLSAELDAQGRIVRQYVYLGDQPLAVIDTPHGKVPARESSLLAQIGADLAIVFHAWFGNDERVVWLHANHLGAVEAASGPDGNVLWRAAYQPFGQTEITAADFTLNLRLPGQYEDSETGLYYNGHRYYDPAQGRYLTPDPLGTPDGPNPYAYVRGNPLRYIDPSGLVLFAFDGTGNDESDPATLSNVVRFRDLYKDGTPFYITGPGTKDPATGIENPWHKGGNPVDVAKSLTGKERIAAMIKYLNDYADSVDDETTFDIDITGFSRGSAEARDFANQVAANTKDGWYGYKVKDATGTEVIKCQKVNFRFMGLFDTVLSTHTGSYQLHIPDAFQYVAHAVALNEYRGNLVAFPSESILGGHIPAGQTRIERGFLGAHSDIGGGFPNQDLAKVALLWMVDQAKLAGITDMGDAPYLHTIIANPVLHDKSDNLLFGAPEGGPTATSEDRDVRYGDGTVVKQRNATTGLMTYADTVPFITYKPDPNTTDNISGTVDMAKYLDWLNKHGYDIDITVE